MVWFAGVLSCEADGYDIYLSVILERQDTLTNLSRQAYECFP